MDISLIFMIITVCTYLADCITIICHIYTLYAIGSDLIPYYTWINVKLNSWLFCILPLQFLHDKVPEIEVWISEHSVFPSVNVQVRPKEPGNYTLIIPLPEIILYLPNLALTLKFRGHGSVNKCTIKLEPQLVEASWQSCMYVIVACCPQIHLKQWGNFTFSWLGPSFSPSVNFSNCSCQ